MYAQAIRRCVNSRFISHIHKVVQIVMQAQRNAIHALKTNRNIIIKPVDKGAAIVIQNRTDYCKEMYRQLNNQKHYRQLPVNPTKGHTHQLNRLIKNFDPDYPMLSHPVYFSHAILRLICFILKHSVFTFKKNQFFIQTYGSAMGMKCAPQYANIFMCKFEQDFFAAQNLQATLYTRYIDDIFFLCTSPERSNYAILHNLQRVINDEKHLAKIFPTPPLLAFKQPPNLKQTIVHNKLPSHQNNIDRNTTQPCHDSLCKTCQIIDMDTTITRGNTTHHVHGRYSCDSVNVVYFIRC
eukprot:g30618.t1